MLELFEPVPLRAEAGRTYRRRHTARRVPKEDPLNATPHDGNESTIKRVKGVLPPSLTIAFLSFAWVELSLNFSFHSVTSGDLGIGLALPSNFQLVTPAGFNRMGSLLRSRRRLGGDHEDSC
jgi:hypothetical protein